MTNLTVSKFGGSLIKDASDFKKVIDVINNEQPSVIVISATKGTTNLLEQIWLYSHQGKSDLKQELINEFENRHIELAKDLNVWEEIQGEFKEIVSELREGPADTERYPAKDFSNRNLDRLDYLLSLGERTSSLILSHCLNDYEYMFASDFIKTDSNFSSANVDFQETQAALLKLKNELLAGKKFVTQGFIGSDKHGKITTLGREGSDYTATILSGALEAKEVTIFTDVPGVFESDPKKWSFCKPIEKLSYDHAETMAEKGAKVLFPKTLMPLRESYIPLTVTNLSRDSETKIVSESKHLPVFIFQDLKMWFYTSGIEGIRYDVFEGMIAERGKEVTGWNLMTFKELPSEAQLRIFFESLQ